MYNSLAGAPTSVNEQLPNRRSGVVHGPGFRTKPMICTWSFGLSEVYEAKAAELAELVPVSFLRIQSITITLDGEFVAWLR